MNHCWSSGQDTGDLEYNRRKRILKRRLQADFSLKELFDIAFQEAVRIYSAHSEQQNLFLKIHQQGANPEKMGVENLEAKYSDLRTGDEQQQKQMMYRRAVEISDRNRERLLLSQSFF